MSRVPAVLALCCERRRADRDMLVGLLLAGPTGQGIDETRMIPGQCRAVFLDLNGTLVLPLLVDRPHEYQLIAQSAEAVRLLCEAGLVCPVITVQ